MVRSAVSKVMWAGRATVFLVGLAMIFALVFGVAPVALAGMGVGAPFNLGKFNTVDKVSTLVNEGRGPALSLQVNSGAPLKVNSTSRVAKLNADMVDGMHVSQLAPRAYARVDPSGNLIAGTSKGINDVEVVTPPNSMYCFDLKFDNPKAAVGSPFIKNNATIATTTGAVNPCPPGYQDAAVRTYTWSAKEPSRIESIDVPVGFSIAFM